MAGLNKEIWISDLLENFYAKESFLKYAEDMTEFVNYNTINLAEAGVDPEVLLNNMVYPVPMREREDEPIELVLKRLDTENTWVKDAELAEVAYEKRNHVIKGHKKSLRMYELEDAIFNYAPQSNGVFTPVLKATGPDDGNGFHSIRFEDILDLELAYDQAEMDQEGRHLVLDAKHKKQLREEDLKLYKEIFKQGEGFANFKFHTLASKRMALYNKDSGEKLTLGEAAGATSTIASVAFHESEVMRASGDATMFANLKDAKYRGDIVGFQKRFLAMPKRNKGLGAIYSPTFVA